MKFKDSKENNNIITIVSGLPRSGTSMMMKMLETGGMEVVVDNIREADVDNPKGYYEFEKVKKIKEESAWLQETRGKVFKMVSMLLFDLPSDENYKVIFMKREMGEMLASQDKMLERRGEKKTDNSKMTEIFEAHLKKIETWLKNQSNIDVLYVSYNDILKEPDENIPQIDQFLKYNLDTDKMIQVVDKSLYRNRK